MKKIKRGRLLLAALEILENVAYSTSDFVEALLNSSKGDYRNLRNYTPKYHEAIAEKIRQEFEDREKFHDLLHRLRRDGMIVSTQTDNIKKWRSTLKGVQKLDKLRKSRAALPEYHQYAKEKSANIIIVSFDVPERERHKREWLRSALYNLGFKMLQKSVLLGKVKIPQEFIQDIKQNKMIAYVEIFSVTKSGTIRHII